MDAYKANLAEEDGIGSGGLWPSDLLHCDDNDLVRSGVCVYYDDGDCNDGDVDFIALAHSVIFSWTRSSLPSPKHKEMLRVKSSLTTSIMPSSSRY